MNTIVTDVRSQLDMMHKHVLEHLKECCTESLEWHYTGKLVDGEIRTAGTFLTDRCFSGSQLVHVENYIKICAMDFVTKHGVKVE